MTHCKGNTCTSKSLKSIEYEPVSSIIVLQVWEKYGTLGKHGTVMSTLSVYNLHKSHKSQQVLHAGTPLLLELEGLVFSRVMARQFAIHMLLPK